jgi:transposase
MPTRKPYPSDISDEEWSFVAPYLVAPYLVLVREDAPQRTHELREVLNGLRWVVRTGSPWRYMPHDLPPWEEAVYQQSRRWLKASVFEAMVHDLRALLRLTEGAEHPSRRLRSWTAQRYAPRPRAGHGAPTTEPNPRKVRRSIGPWTLWGTSARLVSHSG